MAGTSRALTLKLLADINDFTKNINKADNEVSGFGDKIGKFGKVAGAAFAAAGVAAAAYAGKLLVDGVKSAIADEAAQEKLRITLQNVTGATDDQIAATEKYITKTSLAFGVTDDELRPSLERLARATGDVTTAQKLQRLALDISAGSGKSLESVTTALAKAQEGSNTALGKLGVGLSKAELAGMKTDDVFKKLGETFENQATAKANTFQGQMDRLKIAFDEAKETVGVFVLQAITPLIENIVKYVMPALEGFTSGFTGNGGLKEAFEDIIQIAKSIFIPVIDGIKQAFDRVKKIVMENEDSFKDLLEFARDYLAPFLGGAFKIAIQAVGIAVGVVITAVARLIDLFKTMFQFAGRIGDVAGDVASFLNPFDNASDKSAPSLPKGTSGISGVSSASVNNYVTINGAIDPIGTARSISNVLSNAATSTGSFNNLGTSLAYA